MAEPVAVDAELRQRARINFGWLIRLRFATIAGQAITVGVVRFGMGLPIPVAALTAIIALEAASNLAGLAMGRLRAPRDSWLLAVMAFDVLAFSGLLYFTGGPENPFSFLYLVPIAIAAITLRSAWTWALVLLSLVSSLVLFAQHRPLPTSGGHAAHMALHLRGMWVAFGVAAAFIVYFLLRVRGALVGHNDLNRVVDAVHGHPRRMIGRRCVLCVSDHAPDRLRQRALGHAQAQLGERRIDDGRQADALRVGQPLQRAHQQFAHRRGHEALAHRLAGLGAHARQDVAAAIDLAAHQPHVVDQRCGR